MATYVLCHGGWAGGWQWHPIPDLLRLDGHKVFTPTFTGVGERVHLATPDIDLDTFVTDVVNVFLFEDLHEVILVGYSYSGMVVTGVADRIPERISQLVYLDAFVPQDRQSLTDLLGPEITEQIVTVAELQGDGWKVPHMPDPGKPSDTRYMPQSLKTATQPVRLQNPPALALPRSFIYCSEDKESMLMGGPIVQAAKAAKDDSIWRYYELQTDHGPMENLPNELADLLCTIADLPVD